MRETNRELLAYKIAGLLYTPAVNDGIADKIINKSYDCLTSISFCLEDAIMDNALEYAEDMLYGTLGKIMKETSDKSELPLIFIRVRNPEHLKRVHKKMSVYSEILTGYILPKFDISNGKEYLAEIEEINKNSDKTIYAMPILETSMIADKSTRIETLMEIKNMFNPLKEYILNVRVGGNDFCNLFGLRRSYKHTVYDIGVIRDILSDIVNIFSVDFVVSSVVWEYFGTDNDSRWSDGLKRELELDRINGFIGKTAVHPSQLPIIYDSLKVSTEDYNDAKSILNWNDDSFGVSKSKDGSRMNEKKCHSKWAEKIVILGKIYGIKE